MRWPCRSAIDGFIGKVMLRLGLSILASLVAAFGQTTDSPARVGFEVASIRPNTGTAGEAYLQAIPGRLRMQNIALRPLIQLAYGVEAYQLSGGPSWIGSERFDIEAKAEGSPSIQQMEGPMLQALLEDRFKLAVHRETRQMPAWEIRVLNGKGRDGKGKLQPSTAESCIPYRLDSPPPAAPERGQPRPNFCDYPHYGLQGQNRTLDGRGISMAALAQALSRADLHRPVIDKTDLTGMFDIHLEWTPDSMPAPGNPDPSDGPSLFTALREQLGLKLDSSQALAEIIVIDRVEKPTGN